MNIVCLLEKDAQKIVDLYKDNFSDGWNLDMILSAYRAQRFLSFGAFAGEELVGVITCDFNQFDADIEGVVVKKQFRKQGIGALLIEELEKALVNKNIEKIFLEVRKSNVVAQKLYQKMGFNAISQRKEYYSDNEDAIVMAKELKV